MDNLSRIKVLSAAIIAVLGLSACGGGGSAKKTEPTPKTLTVTNNLDAGGDQCTEWGGTETLSGVDDNNNNVLEESEVDSTTYACLDAPETITVVNEIQPGGNQCTEYGGSETLTGVDDNRNGILDADEVDSSQLVCLTAADFAISLDSLKTGISTSSPITYNVTLTEAAESLTVYLSPDAEGTNFGDPDLYIAYEDTPIAGEGVDAGNNVCVSYSSPGYTEVCVIDDPQPGTYFILVDAAANVTNASLYATTSLFNITQACNSEVNIRGQELTQGEVDQACTELEDTKARFDQLINEDIAPDFGQPVPGDLNTSTNINVFASLSNHKSWLEHLWHSTNSSGIYYEFSPADWWHTSDVWTFNGIEWTGGLPVIRSLSHEYVHALDGRYNKAGGYRSQNGWWSEGLAEYLGTHHNLPYQRVVHGHEGAPYSLSQIFNQQNSVDIYSWGELAVAFLFEKRPEKVKEILTHMRAGEWGELDSVLADIAEASQTDFETFYETEVPEQFRNSAQPLAIGDYQLIEGRGGWLYSVDVPAGADSVTFSTVRGSGNVDLWVNQGSAVHPELDDTYTCSSVTANTNIETCTIESPEAGTYYVTVGSDFSGADIVDLYLSVCSGADCSVELPEAKQTVSAAQPYLPHWPEKGEIGSCALEETYGRDTLSYTSIDLTNSTTGAVTLHWINNDGEAGSSFVTLAVGESYVNDAWRVGDRAMIKDASNNCIGVAIVNDTDNTFEVK